MNQHADDASTDYIESLSAYEQRVLCHITAKRNISFRILSFMTSNNAHYWYDIGMDNISLYTQTD